MSGGGQVPDLNLDVGPIQTQSLWTWAPVQSGYNVPLTVVGYPPGGKNQPTKTGLLPSDLQNFVGVQIQQYGNPILSIPPEQSLQWIRWAEDKIERDTGLLLCQSWVAAAPAQAPGAINSLGLLPTSSGSFQIQGIDYDVYEPPYDFFFPRSQDAGWMAYQLRLRPVKSIQYDDTDYTAIKRYSFQYPLLNQFFRVPPTWQVIDQDFGYVRLVPNVNEQLLPLFALYLGFMAFTDSLPGGIWLQYTCGLTPQDYSSRYSFMYQLVLAEAAITALSIIQGTISVGYSERKIQVDGLRYEARFDPNGPYAGLIKTFTAMRDQLMKTAFSKVSGPSLAFL